MSDEKVPEMARQMTLRDWFAGQALAGLTSSDEFTESYDVSESSVTIHEYTAWNAYELADAMIKEREDS